jgi:transcriptional regulator with XRE-family HTH domain
MLDSLLDSRRDQPLTDDSVYPDDLVKLGDPRGLDGFGGRLATLRRARGLSQEELAAQAQVSRRVIAYYETEGDQPPGALLVDLARVLKVSTDELLGVKTVKELASPKTARLLKRLRRVEDLPPADQRAVLKLVDAMLDTRRRSAPPARATRKVG